MQEAAKEIQKKEAENQKGIERTRSTKIFTPAVDIIEKKDDIVVVADMPGVDETSVDITLEKNILTINGRVGPEIPEKHRLVMSEYGVGDFHRVFTISNEIDRDRIQAKVKNGVLRLILPKAEDIKTRKISVKVE